MESRDLKDPYGETRIFNTRALIFLVGVFLLTLMLALRMFYLQVAQHDRYATLSDNNRLLLQSIPANRGLIYDTNGVLLAENRASHSLNITPERIDNLQQTLATLRQFVAVSAAEVERYEKRRTQHRRPYQSVALKLNLSEHEIARIAVNAHLLPGVSVEAQLVRHYPLKGSTAHALGYVGRINEEEMKRIDAASYSGINSIGKIGLEKFYENQLLGKVGYQKVEINARGRVLRVLDKSLPQPGVDIELYLDSRLQRVAEAALGDQLGAVVAIDPRTGGILALVSKPHFDPNLFVTGIDSETYSGLRDSPDLPLFNRALRGQYPPGSIIKPFVGLAALESGNTDWQHSIYDVGWYQLKKNGRFYRDWKKYGHGRVDLGTAIIRSCDTYFYELAHRMGVEPIHDLMHQFGFGQRTALDMAESVSGILPSSEWKKNALGESWYTGDSLNASIGQGFMLSTPLQMATAMAVLANRGRWVQPRLMKRVRAAEQEISEQRPERRELKPLEDVQLNYPENWEKMIAAMEAVVHGEHGTARNIARDIRYRIAGKTGTAQVIGIKQDEEYDKEKIAKRNQDHALFAAFAPVDKPRIAIAIIVENGGGGGTAAAPVARKVMDAYLLDEASPGRDKAGEDVAGFPHINPSPEPPSLL